MSTPQSRLGGDPIEHLFGAPPATAPPSGSSSRSPKPRRPAAFDSLTDGVWSLPTEGPKVREWFRTAYGRDLPVKAEGQSATHDSMGYDHSDAMDVGVNPTSPEGAALRAYLRENRIPFLAFDRAIPGVATG